MHMATREEENKFLRLLGQIVHDSPVAAAQTFRQSSTKQREIFCRSGSVGIGERLGVVG